MVLSIHIRKARAKTCKQFNQAVQSLGDGEWRRSCRSDLAGRRRARTLFSPMRLRLRFLIDAQADSLCKGLRYSLALPILSRSDPYFVCIMKSLMVRMVLTV